MLSQIVKVVGCQASSLDSLLLAAVKHSSVYSLSKKETEERLVLWESQPLGFKAKQAASGFINLCYCCSPRGIL